MRKLYTITVSYMYKDQLLHDVRTLLLTEMEAALESINVIHNHVMIGDVFVSLEIKKRK